MTNVIEMMALMSTPIRPATDWFSAVARMARPSLVRCTRNIRPAMNATETTMITTCTGVMVAPKTWNGSVDT